MKKKIFSILAAVCCSVGLMAQDEKPYFSMTALDANVTVKLVGVKSPTSPETIQYSTDRSVWTNIEVGTTEITVAPETPVYFRHGSETAVKSLYTKYTTAVDISTFGYLNFTMSGTGKIALGGQIRSLLDQTLPGTDTQVGAVAFYGLFENCTNIVSIADGLFMTTKFSGARYAFANMFKGCTGLTNVPSTRPDKAPSVYTFSSMYEGCTGLTTVPTNLLAIYTTLANGAAFPRMFFGCSNLTNAPELPATALYASCYESMFEGCQKLEVAPELKISDPTKMKTDCYKRMFYGCTSLQSIKVGFTQWTTTSGDAFTTEWLPDNEGAVFNGPTSLINAVSANRTTSTIPAKWAVEMAPINLYSNYYENSAYHANSVNDKILEGMLGQEGYSICLMNRPIKAGMWNTICLPFAMTEAQVAETFGEGTLIGHLTRGETKGEELFLDFETDVTAIEAGVPYIIKPSVAEDIAQPVCKNVTITKTLGGSYTVGDVTFRGTFGVVTENEVDNMTYYYGLAEDQMIHPLLENTGLYGFRAYFHWGEQEGEGGKVMDAPKRVVMTINEEQTVTADEQLRMDEATSTKMMLNGQLVIMRDGIRYNAQGQEIQ